jgi:hypothetical protein
MKLRHAAAIALVGWYLMIPPQICPNSPYSQVPCYRDPSVSLNKWTRADYFDSVDACDDRLHTLKNPFPPGSPSQIDEYQCVYEGDPRLAN